MAEPDEIDEIRERSESHFKFVENQLNYRLGLFKYLLKIFDHKCTLAVNSGKLLSAGMIGGLKYGSYQ